MVGGAFAAAFTTSFLIERFLLVVVHIVRLFLLLFLVVVCSQYSNIDNTDICTNINVLMLILFSVSILVAILIVLLLFISELTGWLGPVGCRGKGVEFAIPLVGGLYKGRYVAPQNLALMSHAANSVLLYVFFVLFFLVMFPLLVLP